MSKKKFTGGLDETLGAAQQSKLESTVSKAIDRSIDGPKNSPKWAGFTKVNALLGAEQKDFLDSLTKKVMRSRDGGKERITSNSILRCLIDVLEERIGKLDLSGVSSEEELRNRLSKL